MNNFRTVRSVSPITLLPTRLSAVMVAQKLVFAATLLAFLGTSQVRAGTAVSLSDMEHQMANQLANNQAWQQQRNAPNDNLHPLGDQTLSVELEERKKGSHQRRARVYQYNYNTQQSRLVLVDLDKQAVVKQQPINSVHLPLNAIEIQTARTLVEQSDAIMSRLNQSRKARGHSPLNNLSSLEVKASIFEPNNHSHYCAKQRCALISLFDNTRTVFTVEPLVNLQSLSVTTLQQSL